MGATVVQLPEDIRDRLGIVNNERMRFVFNISVAAPILEITLGEKNGQTFIRPLAMAYPPKTTDPKALENINAVLVDYASLVIAPRGGEVGPYVYQPGISIGFAATISGTPIDISATIDIPGASVSADVEIGAFTVGSVNMKRTDLELRINPSQIKFELSGGFDLKDGSSSLDLYVLLDANISQGGFRLKIEGDGNNIPLLPGFTLEEMRILVDVQIGAANLGGGGFDLTIDAFFKFNVLGAKPSIQATLKIADGELKQLKAQLAIEPIIVAGTGITGDGCDGVTGREEGICVKIDYDKLTPSRQNSPFEFLLTGALSVVEIKAKVTMSYDQEGFALAGSLRADPVGFIEIEGRFYRKTATQAVTPKLPGATPIIPTDGNFTLTGRGAINIANIVATTVDFSVGSVGSGSQRATWVYAAGALDTEVFDLSISGNFGSSNGATTFNLKANGELTLVGQKLASVTGSVNNQGFNLNGSLLLPTVDLGKGPVALGGATVGVTMRFATANQPLGFRFSGAASINSPFDGTPLVNGSVLAANINEAGAPIPPEVAIKVGLVVPIIQLAVNVEGRITERNNAPSLLVQGGVKTLQPLPLLGTVDVLVGFGFNNVEPKANGVWARAQAFDILFAASVTQAGFEVKLKTPADENLKYRDLVVETQFIGHVVGGYIRYGFDGSLSGPPVTASVSGVGEVAVYWYPIGQEAKRTELAAGLRFTTTPKLKACITMIGEICSPEIGA